MRVIGEIPHEGCKITIFSWNNKYLIKLERGPIEQTYKVAEMDVSGDDDINELLDSTFMQEAMRRFEEMDASLAAAMERLY